MAFTFEKTLDDVTGQTNKQVYVATFTGVTAGDIDTGFNNVVHASFNNETTAPATCLMQINKDTNGSTVKGGSIHFSGFSASDVVTIVVEGN